MVRQDPSYSPFEIHTCRNVPREDEIDPPIDTECFLSGGATTMIFIVSGDNAVGSFVTLSKIPWNMVVPLDSTTLIRVRLLADVHVALRKEVSWIPLACVPVKLS